MSIWVELCAAFPEMHHSLRIWSNSWQKSEALIANFIYAFRWLVGRLACLQSLFRTTGKTFLHVKFDSQFWLGQGKKKNEVAGGSGILAQQFQSAGT